MERFPAEKTGHMIASYRARFAEISLDEYAHLWVDDEVERLHDAILAEVSPCEDLAHALRNRFFLTHLREFFGRHPDGVLINLAAGLSHHALLLGESVKCIEVERAAVIQLKRESFSKWAETGLIPRREVEFRECDLNDPAAIEKLGMFLAPRIADRPTFLVMEGLLFFLERGAIDAIFEHVARRLPVGSRVGSVSFEGAATHGRAYSRLVGFFDRTLARKDAVYSVIDDDYYHALEGLELVEKTDYAEIVTADAELRRRVPDLEELVVESLYVLERV